MTFPGSAPVVSMVKVVVHILNFSQESLEQSEAMQMATLKF